MPHVISTIGSQVGDLLDDLSEQWIGWTFPPVERAFAEAKWHADDAAAYCARCGDSIAPGEATPDGCGTCRSGGELDGGIADGVVRLGAYVEPLRGWLHAIKYQRWIEMGDALGTMLGERVMASGLVDADRAVVVPMPMPWQRRMYRGIDHAALLASAVARAMDCTTARLLARSIHATQVSLTPGERKRSGSRGMRLRRRFGGWGTLAGAHLVLVDDVRTTGATLKAACRFLWRLKPERLVCAVAAVSDSAARRMRQHVRKERGARETFDA